VFDGDSNRIISGTVNQPTACCGGNHTWGFQGATKRRTNTYQFAVGGRYDAGALQVTGDIARTNSTFNLRTESIDYEINTKNYSVDWFTGEVDGDGPTFQVRGIDPTDPSIYNYRGFFEDHLTAKGEDWQARLDFEYEPSGIDFIRNVQWGVRGVNRDASARAGAFYWNLRDRGIPISAVPLDYELAPRGFRNDSDAPFPMRWLAPTFDSVWDNLTELRQFNIALTNSGSVDGPPDDPARTFNINEKSYAAYGQLNYEFDAGGTPIDGAIGMRVVKTKADIRGNLGTPTGVEEVDFKNSYTDWLPNASVRARFTPELQLRLAATKTRTRPTFEQLNPALRLAPPPACGSLPAGVDCVRGGTSGNPFLKPLKSNNYDASLEYFFSRTGFASVGAFRRDMRGFIANRTVQFPEPDPESGATLVLTGPVNTRKARIQGFEAQVSTFFDFLPGWMSGLGAQANVTYIDAKATFLVFPESHPNHAVIRERIPDVSKWTWNLVGMYEKGGLTTRLAYNHRTGFPEADLAERDNFFTLQGRGHAVSRLDWSSSYAFTDKFTVFFDWTNILKKPFRSDIVRVNYPGGSPSDPEIFPMVVRNEESVISSGIRFRFGGDRAPRAAPEPMAPLPPPPPPVVTQEPAPPPPPPPAPAPSGERG
jgi:TonB-dependent receptor